MGVTKLPGRWNLRPWYMDGKVFAGSADDFLYAFDAATGEAALEI